MTQGTRPGLIGVAITTTALALCATTSPRLADAETPLPASGEVACERAALGDCDFRDPATGFVFVWPNDWPVRRLKIVTESGPPAGARQRAATRWIALQYVPDDPTQPEVPLLTLAVLKRGDWIAESDRARVTTAVEIATGVEHVAVVTLSGGNPFPVDSRDADIFEALQPTAEQVSRTVRFPEPGVRARGESRTRLARGDVIVENVSR